MTKYFTPLFFGFLFCSVIASSRTIETITFHLDNQEHLNSASELISIKPGDEFSQNNLNLSVKRLAQNNIFKHVSGHFEPKKKQLSFYIQSYKNINKITYQSNIKSLDKAITKNSPVLTGDILNENNLKSIKKYTESFLEERGYLINNYSLTQVPSQTFPQRTDIKVNLSLSVKSYLNKATFTGFNHDDLNTILKGLGRQPLPLSEKKTKEILFKNTPYNKKKIESMLSSLSKKYRGKNYFNAKFKIAELVSEKNVNLKNITVNFNKGNLFNLQITNNTAFWENNLRELISDRIINLDIPFSVNDSIKTLVTKYKESGYKDVRVESSVQFSKKVQRISFKIIEGKKYFFKEAQFIRSPGQHSEILEHIKEQWIDSLKTPYSKIAYDENNLRSKIPELLDLIHNYGFVEANILSYQFSPIKKNSILMRLDLNIRLGTRFKLGELNISHQLKNISYKERISKVKKDYYFFNRSAIEKIIQTILKDHRDNGFLDVSVDLNPEKVFSINPRSRAIDVKLSFVKGKKIIFGKLLVSGLKRTKKKVVTRELKGGALEEGHVWTPKKKQKLDDRLYALGLFKSINFQNIPSTTSYQNIQSSEIRDLKIGLQERAGGSIEFGPGYRTDLGLIAFSEFNYRNLGGWNRGLHLRAQISRKIKNYQFPEQNYSLVYIEPFPLEQRALLRAELEYKKDDDLQFDRNGNVISGFNLEESTFDLRLEKPLWNHYLFIWNIFNYALPRITNIVNLSNSNLQKYKIGSIGAEIRIDYRDDIFNPSKGVFITNEVQYSSPLLRSTKDAHFVHYKFKGNYYWNVQKKAVLAFSLGYERLWGLGNSNGVPENRRLVLGGRDSLRSLPANFLRFDDIGVLSQESFNGRAEYRVPLFDGWGLAPFFEGARIDVLKSKNTLPKSTTGFRMATGVSFRYTTPVGPVSLDLAKNIDPQANEDKFRLELSIGSF